MRDIAEYAAQEWDVIVIGGGATGAGVLRDLAMRGLKPLLLEQRDLAHGTSSRFHGLLHSGARYAVSDAEAARECIAENRILRAIGRHCVENTEGLFVLTPEDREADPNFEERWFDACTMCGIEAEPIPVEQALQIEPNLSPDILAAYRVPDAAVDGFRLVWQNVLSARRHGAAFRTYTEVRGIAHKGGHVVGVEAADVRTGESAVIPCRFVVNAAGSWAGELARMAGLDHISIRPDRGALIAFNHRFSGRVVNRLHKASDGDIFVPHGSITILGTTSRKAERPDDFEPTTEEVLRLLDIGRKVFPRIDSYRILRAFVGTRPLYAPPETAGGDGGRGVSRNFVVLDHEKDGLAGMLTICGGKLTTYRVMAERAADLACAKLGVNAICRTAEEALVSEISPELHKRAAACFPPQGLELAISRLGDLLEATVQRMESDPWKKALLCECELVTFAEFEQIAQEPTSHSLNDIRRRTRMGMGTCQGAFCSVRGIGALAALRTAKGETATQADQGDQPASTDNATDDYADPSALLRRFQQERWHGIRPALWGGALREAELTRSIYGATLNIDGGDCE